MTSLILSRNFNVECLSFFSFVISFSPFILFFHLFNCFPQFQAIRGKNPEKQRKLLEIIWDLIGLAKVANLYYLFVSSSLIEMLRYACAQNIKYHLVMSVFYNISIWIIVTSTMRFSLTLFAFLWNQSIKWIFDSSFTFRCNLQRVRQMVKDLIASLKEIAKKIAEISSIMKWSENFKDVFLLCSWCNLKTYTMLIDIWTEFF